MTSYTPILLQKDKIQIAKSMHIHIFDSIDSTNKFLKDIPSSTSVHVCCAETQTQGRGRFGRTWHSPFGENIYFSMRLRIETNIAQLSSLSLVVSMAIISMLQEINAGENIYIKWPNDLLYQNQKLCGSLIESIKNPDGSIDVIIGIGLNVNSITNNTILIDQPWCSLYEITGTQFDRNVLISRLIIQLQNYINKFQIKGLKDFMNAWKKTDYLYGKQIIISQATEILQGTAKGINNSGQLILIDNSGVKHVLSSGETSLHSNKIYE